MLDAVLDPDSWQCWDVAPVTVPTDEAYAAQLERARERTGLDESVRTGEGLVAGRRVAVAVCEFGFLAGSIGVAAAERLVLAIERATREGLPLVASPTSGGTRMQEGTVAFLQMVKISAAVAAHKAAGLPYVVYLRHPTTGGVFASWGSLGHVTAAEPGALIGFLGPRVYEALYGDTFPEGVQTAENLFHNGLLDAVVPVQELGEVAARTLSVLAAGSGTGTLPGSKLDRAATDPAAMGETHQASADEAAAEHDDAAEDLAAADVPAWSAITRSRRDDRPGARSLLALTATDMTPLNGTGEGETDPGLLLALARIHGVAAVVLGQDRRAQSTAGVLQPLGPGALRTARRGMRLAAGLGLPLVTIIDTQGAALSREAEEGGMAGEIARSLAELVALTAPTVCLLMGQGAGGGALALLPADRVIAAQHAWLSPLPPEGASAIRYRTVDRAQEIAAEQGVRALDLRRHGVVDRIVPERPDAALEPVAFCRRLAAVLAEEIEGLAHKPGPDRVRDRVARYRRLGLPE